MGSDPCFKCGRDMSFMNSATGDEMVEDEVGNRYCSEGCSVAQTTSTADTSGIDDGTFMRGADGFTLEKGELLS
jgi:hypothetical protein